jgi:putative transposase
MSILTFKFRLYPSKKQKKILDFSFDECLIIYNQLLCVRKQTYEKDKTTISKFDCNKIISLWKENERPQLNQIHSQVLQQVSSRLDKAFKSFFQRVKSKKGKAGYPRYQKDNFSITYPQSGFSIKEGKLYLSKIGKVKIKIHRWFPEKIKQCTIKKTLTGKYFICFVCEIHKNELPKTNSTTAFDLGIKSFLHTSENEIIENPKYLNKSLKKLKNIQSQFSKTKSERHKLKLRILFEKVRNQREDFLHKLSNKIVKENDVIIFEDLNIKSMLEKDNNRNLNRNINDVSWNSFIQKLDYKAENAGRQIVKVNPANTSNSCFNCGIKHEIDLSIRNLPCCGIDRDLNAALNIKRLGLESLGL